MSGHDNCKLCYSFKDEQQEQGQWTAIPLRELQNGNLPWASF